MWTSTSFRWWLVVVFSLLSIFRRVFCLMFRKCFRWNFFRRVSFRVLKVSFRLLSKSRWNWRVIRGSRGMIEAFIGRSCIRVTWGIFFLVFYIFRFFCRFIRFLVIFRGRRKSTTGWSGSYSTERTSSRFLRVLFIFSWNCYVCIRRWLKF